MSRLSTSRRAWIGGIAVAVLALVAFVVFRSMGPRPYRIGSKKFTEGVILGDVLTLLLETEQVPVEHERELGGTRIVFGALKTGEIDAYVDYTGTIQREILGVEGAMTRDAMEAGLAERGIVLGPPLGFSNSYALGMRRERAAALGILTISDLRAHPDLKLGFTHEFRERDDGWPGLREAYGLPQTDVSGLDHEIAYKAIASGAVDVIELYTTDAKIQSLDLVALEDDLAFFPRYDAVILYRADLERRAPAVVAAFELLRDRIDEAEMTALNAGVDLEKRREVDLAAQWLASNLDRTVEPPPETWYGRLAQRTWEHLTLVTISLLIAIVLGIALGVVAAKTGGFGQLLIGVVGAAQTFPGLAFLALMVLVLGVIGEVPTIVALVVYSLLPIVRNTHAGITGIPRPLRESSRVLGLSEWMRLTQVELPLAAPSIFAGIKTAAVWNVGLATLGALVGAGGYGQSIMSGLRRGDNAMILEGAIPAILLALVVQAFFDLVERGIVSPGLRHRHGSNG